MKLTTEISFHDDNQSQAGVTEVVADGNFVTITIPDIPSKKLKLFAPDLREFLIRAKPNLKFQQDQ